MSSGDAAETAMYREWAEPVADLLRWPEQSLEAAPSSPPAASPTPVTASASELLDLVLDPDGEWASKKATLRQVARGTSARTSGSVVHRACGPS